MNSISDCVRHTFVFPDRKKIDARFRKNIRAGEAAAAAVFKASSIDGIPSDICLSQLPPQPLFLRYDSIIKWNDIYFTNLNDIEVIKAIEAIDCSEEDKRFVRTTIETPAGPFVYYERQQKLHITLKYQHEHINWGLFGPDSPPHSSRSSGCSLHLRAVRRGE
jgi:hypothetical protein